MVNAYTVVACPHCRHGIATSERPSVMVHGAENLARALAMIEQGINMSEIRSKFCGYCGGYMPCGCEHPEPQETIESTEMKDLATAKYTNEQRRKVLDWIERAEPSGEDGMVMKGTVPPFPEGCEPDMKTVKVSKDHEPQE